MDDRMPSWMSSMHKSMQSMHNRMMNWMTKQFNGNDADDVDITDVFDKVFDMRHDMSELIFAFAIITAAIDIKKRQQLWTLSNGGWHKIWAVKATAS